MNAKTAKGIRKKVKKEATKIQLDALRQWAEFVANKPFWQRMKFCVKLMFKRLPIQK